MPAKSRTRTQVALISGQRAVILMRAAWSASVSLPGGVRIQLATFFGAGGGRAGRGGCLAQLGGVATQRAQAAAVAAGADLFVQLVGVPAAFLPPFAQVGQVRVEQASPGGRGACGQLARARRHRRSAGLSCGPAAGRG